MEDYEQVFGFFSYICGFFCASALLRNDRSETGRSNRKAKRTKSFAEYARFRNI